MLQCTEKERSVQKDPKCTFSIVTWPTRSKQRTASLLAHHNPRRNTRRGGQKVEQPESSPFDPTDPSAAMGQNEEESCGGSGLALRLKRVQRAPTDSHRAPRHPSVLSKTHIELLAPLRPTALIPVQVTVTSPWTRMGILAALPAAVPHPAGLTSLSSGAHSPDNSYWRELFEHRSDSIITCLTLPWGFPFFS